ncbi:MAG: hypothetical protein KAQ98_12080 [Bacteriovoracaceae bacterium]|nr:hypothetical protein [Bacteriovoracaceae bacterium]
MDMLLARDFLLWAFLINLGFMFLWFFIIIFAHNLIYKMHSKFFQISKEQFDAIHYAGIAFYKIVIFTFFLVPYVVLSIIGR